MHTETQALAVIQKHVKQFPTQLAILGSGWNHVLDNAKIETEIGFKEWLGVEASVPGHEGKLVIATVQGTRVAIMVGRIHTFEGYTTREATLPIRVLAQAGVKEMLVTSASGALNQKYQVGDFVLLNDILTVFMSLDNPLIGPQFIDLSQAFDIDLRTKMRKVLVKNDVSMKEGVYCYYHGPNYETPADKMALRILGADVCGMSTVPETIMARALGLKVIGLSFVTNLAFVKHDHKDVIAAAEASGKQMTAVLEQYYKA